jgi:hypothetical protein
VLGAHHADDEKMGMTEEELAQAHAVLDAKRKTFYKIDIEFGKMTASLLKNFQQYGLFDALSPRESTPDHDSQAL